MERMRPDDSSCCARSRRAGGHGTGFFDVTRSRAWRPNIECRAVCPENYLLGSAPGAVLRAARNWPACSMAAMMSFGLVLAGS